MSYFDYENQLLGYFENLKMSLLSRPLFLGGIGGSGGGTGGPVGGIVGQLIQTKIAYDYDELASSGLPTSGWSLLDNLNHIRYRVQQLEGGSGVSGSVSIYSNGTLVATGITVLDFVGGVVTQTASNRVSVQYTGGGGGGESVTHRYNETLSGVNTFSTAYTFASGTLQVYYNGLRQDDSYFTPNETLNGFTTTFSLLPGDEIFVDYDIAASGTTTSGVTTGGHTIQDEGTSLPARTYLNFVGSSVAVTDDSANDRTIVTVTATSSGGTSADEKVKVSSNDTTANYLASKLVAGSSITITENNNGSNETLTIAYSGVGSFPRVALLTFGGTLSGISNPFRLYNVFGQTVTISKVFIAANTAPTGQNLIVDIHKNGTTIFTNQANRPTIVAGNNTGETTTIQVPSWAVSEYLTAELDQVGSAVPGSDLSVHIVYY